MSRMESNYFAHMAFDPEHTRQVRSHYAPMFEGCGSVLELACGQGEFLGLLAERGAKVFGVDSDEGMAQAARAAGHEVALADAVEFLHGDPAPGPFEGVFCAHLLEHLVPEQAARMLAGVRRVLAPDGVFVAVVPNPACFAVLTHDFWRDPTHVRFYDIPLIEFLCAEAGLRVEASGANPLDHPGPPPGYEADLVYERPPSLPSSLVEDGAGPLGEVVGELARRLTETQHALRDLERAHRTLVQGMYPPNEVFVMARG
jgi:O-antigen chain-terminating methyltransferase